MCGFFLIKNHDLQHSLPLIYLTETINEALDQRKYVCGIFVDLKKVFGTVDRNILIVN